MAASESKSGSDLFIVDNSDQDWKVLRYLHDWCALSRSIDIATGYFEIGSLLALKDEWRKVDQIRILMGDEVSRRTTRAFAEGLDQVKHRLDDSIEAEKEKNDFLKGVPAIVKAIRSGQILCRVYRKDKFHAKAYITHARQEVIGSFGLAGSSNFTYPGLTENVELNVQIAGRQVTALQEWYDRHWDNAEDVSEELLRVIERHTREYPPFDVYAKSLQELFRGHEMTADEWELAGPENGGSRMYHVLDKYQQDGYHALLKIARQFGGAFLCDGVGLGKTFVGLMLIERLIMKDRKRVALLVPKAARVDVWEPALREYLRYVGGVSAGDFSNLAIFSHTDLGREGDFPYRFDRMRELADVFVIDEAHHFRNPGFKDIKGESKRQPSRYRMLFDLIDGPRGPKQVYLLTATPINNRLDDFRHMIELFSRQQENYFAPLLGIHSLRGHFIRMKRELQKAVAPDIAPDVVRETNLAEAAQVLKTDTLFQELVVQRSRAYVKASQQQQGASTACFPTREPPRVAEYSVKKTYGRLLEMVDRAFKREKPLFVLGIYYPLYYYKGPDESIDPLEESRQEQVVGLIRTQFLKRFESSAYAFERSCQRLMLKLLAWANRHSETDREKERVNRWRRQHEELIGYVHERQLELLGDGEEDSEEDIITPEMIEDVEHLSREEYDVEEILADTFLDLDQIAEFMDELRKFKPRFDNKLQALIQLLRKDKVLSRHKVLIFTEFADTARYLQCQLVAAGIEGVEEIDSGTKRNRSEILRRFAPYYNGSSSAEVEAAGEQEIRILISTDVLSEGLNLQDATRLINYDLHWNPVRLMQRIGRVDRRLNPAGEQRLLADHPEQSELRGNIIYWNFLPPDELNELLTLYSRVSRKTLLISKTFGIEGRKLLRPEDDYDALREFNESFEGEPTPTEGMRLEFNDFLKADPELESRLNALPGRVFSGKEHPSPGARAVFFCSRIPRPDHAAEKTNGDIPWTEEAGETKWYLYSLADGAILEDPPEIAAFIRCKPDTLRHCAIEQETLSDIRAKVDKQIKNTYLKKMQAPVGVKPILKAWMELS